MKKGFTMAEALVTLGVIAALAMILLPVLKNAMPNKSMIMFKKTYYIIERVASELVNDDDLYPDVTGNSIPPYLGNTTKITHENAEYSGNTKFCNLFGQKMNVRSKIECTAQTFTDGEASLGQFVTSDNIAYILPISSFGTQKKESIYIDVNAQKTPNCFYNEETCKAPDRFEIKINQKGTLCVEGIREAQYLASNDITKKAEDYKDIVNTYVCPADPEGSGTTGDGSNNDQNNDGCGDGYVLHNGVCKLAASVTEDNNSNKDNSDNNDNQDGLPSGTCDDGYEMVDGVCKLIADNSSGDNNDGDNTGNNGDNSNNCDKCEPIKKCANPSPMFINGKFVGHVCMDGEDM